MDNVSCMEGLKLDSHSEVIDTDSGGNDLFSPAMIPLNTPTIVAAAETLPPLSHIVLFDLEILLE
ncbi:hypothetical protein Pyn_26855 [Prunus yedoensis var. nudiflora]|uniref:Uncharacterized protein n=1 Tax=Prunus yedoensis var. nudiflora TaxID=2094558 RepID=A0A314Y895_PRUYE|nr:hypothetical protein Pyn_26855 [Prunus yedoensis var. nudiflora]